MFNRVYIFLINTKKKISNNSCKFAFAACAISTSFQIGHRATEFFEHNQLFLIFLSLSIIRGSNFSNGGNGVKLVTFITKEKY